jgi:hypothetical protein
MHDMGVLLTFAGGLAGVLVLGFIALRSRLSPIVGYLLAGILVGPFTPGFVADRAVAQHFDADEVKVPQRQLRAGREGTKSTRSRMWAARSSG